MQRFARANALRDLARTSRALRRVGLPRRNARRVRAALCHAVVGLLVSVCGNAGQTLPASIATSASVPGLSSAINCQARASLRDSDGRYIGTTGDSTTIRVAAPTDLTAGTELQFRWYMTGGPVTPLVVYAERADSSRVSPRLTERLAEDDYAVFITLPTPGCWRFHSERTNGKDSGDIWLTVGGH